MADSPARFHRIFQKLKLPLQQPVIHLHKLPLPLMFLFLADVQIETEYKKLQRTYQKKIRYNLKDTGKVHISVQTGIHNITNAEQTTYNHRDNADPVCLPLHIIAKSFHIFPHIFFEKESKEQEQKNTCDNIYPYASSKEKSGNFDGADNIYRHQIKYKHKLIYFHPDVTFAEPKGKQGKAKIHHMRPHPHIERPIRQIPEAGQCCHNHTETQIIQRRFFPVKP